MKKLFNIFAVAVMVMAMAACGDDPTGDINIPISDKVVSIDAVPAGEFTKATDTAFEVGDAVSIFGFKGAEAAWLPWLTNGKFTKTVSGFTPDQTYYWYAGEETSTIIGLYPYNAAYTPEALVAGGVEFCVKADQSTHAGYTASDLMTAIKTNVAPTNNKVVLEFDHLLSKLVIDIANQTISGIKEVFVDGVKGNIQYSYATGISLTGGAGTVKAGELAVATDGYTNTFVLIIPPQQAAPSLAITTYDGKQYTYNASGDIDFGSGKVRHLMVTITDESISTDFDAIVNDWSADEDVEFSEQPNTGGGNEDDDDVPVVEGMSVNPLWNVELIPEFYEEETGTTYNDLIRVVSSDENNGFYIEFFDENYYNTSIKPDIKAYVQLRAENLIENLNNYNAENNADFNFLNYRNYRLGACDELFILNPGRCVVAMWGMGVNGEITGLYYISDVMEVRDPATPEYKAWLGTYTLKDSNDLTSEITISQNVVNESFLLDGWNGVYGNPIVLPFNPTGGEFGNGSVEINSQLLASDFYIEDTLINKLVFGGLLTTENNEVMYMGEGYALAVMSWWSEEPGYLAVINSYGYQLSGGETATVTNAGYFLEYNDSVSTGTENLHSFPAYLTSKTEEEPASMAARKRNPFEDGNNGIARPLSEVRRANQPIGNYVVGGRKFNAVNF